MRFFGVLALFLWSWSATVLANTTPHTRPTFDQLSAQAKKASHENRLEDATRLYSQALVLRPKWAEGWWELATLEYDLDRYAKAAIAFQRLVALQPENGTAYAMLGLCEFETGRDQLALTHIRRGKTLGVQKNPKILQVVLYHEGVLEQRRGAFQAAEDALELLCADMGPNDTAANVLGMAMLQLSAKDPPPDGSSDADVVLRVGRAQCLGGQKKYDEARAVFEAVIRQNPKYPNIHYAYGLFLLELLDIASAVEQFKQEIANQPNDVIARLRLAASEYKIDSASGIPYAEEAVKLAPQQPFAHYLLGLLRLDVDQYQEAIPELELAEKGLPHEAKVYAALASAYSRAGRKQEAAKARATFARLNEQVKTSAQDGRSTNESGEAKNPLSDSVSVPQ